MLTAEQLASLHSNQRFVAQEMIRRGVEVDIYDAGPLYKGWELLTARYKDHEEILMDRDSSITPYVASVFSGDKFLTKVRLQQAAISVVKGEQFYPTEMNEALIYSQDIGYPVVVKPTFGSHGDGVYMDLINPLQVKHAIEELTASRNNSGTFIVEEQFEGKEYRVFITASGRYAVVHRDPAHVIGDGGSTIEQLADKETERRKFPHTSLCPVRLDEVVDSYLSLQDMTRQSIPDQGAKIYLRHNSNVAAGATCEDYTDKVHPSVISIARVALSRFPGMPLAGIDFLSKDIAADQTPDMYRILEVNSRPGVSLHMLPGTGQPRDVAGAMVDLIFPQTAAAPHLPIDYRIPVVKHG